jgi:hypothetical protein
MSEVWRTVHAEKVSMSEIALIAIVIQPFWKFRPHLA